jgi:hypothetical protein
MLTAGLVLLALAGAPERPLPGAVSRFFPCEPGLRIVYAERRRGEDTGVRRTETVVGPGALPGTCLLERTREGPGLSPSRDPWLLEHLPDRVAIAGWAATPTLFRPPILKAPLEPGQAWAFDRQRWRVLEAGVRVRVPAGVFDGCVVVEDVALEGGPHRARVTYAPGVGPVNVEANGEQRVALRVERAGEGGRGGGGGRRLVRP